MLEILEIKKDFLEAIESCSWFENCGDDDKRNFQFEVAVATNKLVATNTCTGRRWQDSCCEKRKEFTDYIALNHKEIYAGCWNRTYINNMEYVEKVVDRAGIKLKEKGFDNSVVVDVEFNVSFLFMVNCYSDYYKDDFFEKMLNIYLAGHLPCGWVGTKDEEKFLVY